MFDLLEREKERANPCLQGKCPLASHPYMVSAFGKGRHGHLLNSTHLLVPVRATHMGFVASAHYPYIQKAEHRLFRLDPESARLTRISHVQAMGDISDRLGFDCRNRFGASAGA